MKIEELKIGPVVVTGKQEHPNRWRFSGTLCILDTPSDRAVRGTGGKRVILPKSVAEQTLHSLLGMAVDFELPMLYHAPKRKVGVITSARISGNELLVSGYVFALDFPEVVEKLQSTPHIGMSFMCTNVKVFNPHGEILVLRDLVFTGASILEADATAWKRTSLAAEAEVVGIPTGIILPLLPHLLIDASDWLGPEIVRHYAHRISESFAYRAKGLNEKECAELREQIKAKVVELDGLAYEMQHWQLGHPGEVKWS